MHKYDEFCAIKMSSINNMKQALRPLSLYNLSNTTLIHAELSVYAAEFDRLQSLLSKLEQECFINTATDFGLTYKEKILGKARTDLSVSNRREMLLYREAITSNDFNLTFITQALIAAGIRGNIVEKPSLYQIHINCLELVDSSILKEDAEREARKFLPAHIEAFFDFRPLQWKVIDNLNKTFSQMDAKDFTWKEIDSNEFSLN